MLKVFTSLLAGATVLAASGAVSPPFDVNFAEGSTIEGFTVVDANNDNVTWEQGETGLVTIRYNMIKPNNDWFITPALELKAGMVYDMMYVAHSAGTKYTETLEIKYGTSPTAEGMAETLLPPTEVNMKRLERTLHFSPAADGVYYIGFHAMSPRDQLGEVIEEIHISAGLEGRVPEGVSELTVTPDATGLKKADISFTTPTLTFNGTQLGELTSVRVLRDGTEVKRFDNPATGVTLSFTDTPEVCGEYVYSVVTANSFGDGPEIKAKYVFVGHDRPEAPADASCAETANQGEVTVTWTPVTKDVNGRPLTEADVTYKLMQSVTAQGKFTQATVVAENLTGTSFTTMVVNPGDPQAHVKYTVYAVTEGGEGKGFTTLSAACGEPYIAPFKESVAEGLPAYNWGSDAWVGSYTFYPMFDSTYDDIKSCDDDGGYFMMHGDDYWDTSFLTSGKIDLSNLDKPKLSFYGLVVPKNSNYVTVSINSGEGFVVADEFVMTCEGEEGKDGGWQRFEVDLAPYKGKTVQVRFKGVLIVMSYIALDCIEVYNQSENDMAVASVAAPAAIKSGETGRVDVTVENRGLNATSAYTINLYRDGALVESVAAGLPELAPKAVFTRSFDIAVSPVETEPMTIKAEVTLAGDENPADNTKEVQIAVTSPSTPAPRDLDGTVTDGGDIVLTWTEPDRSGEPETTVESFESYDNFLIDNIGQWSVIDADGAKSCGWGDYTSHIPHLYSEPFAYMVMDQTVFDPESSLYDKFIAHTGDKYLVSANNFDREIDKDDWLISPLLNGSAQKVTFYARGQFSYRTETSECYEQFEFLTSSAGKTADEFEMIGFHDLVPKEWTKYEFDLPEGTNYFAIRATSHDAFWLMLDDITFISLDGDPSKLELIGYNVYDKGVKLNSEPVTATTWTLPAASADGAHRFHVSALYRQCESGGSNPYTVNVSGLGAVDAPLAVVKTDGHDILVLGAQGQDLRICNLAGVTVHDGKSTGADRIRVAPGMYIVSMPGRNVKVMVK